MLQHALSLNQSDCSGAAVAVTLLQLLPQRPPPSLLSTIAIIAVAAARPHRLPAMIHSLFLINHSGYVWSFCL